MRTATITINGKEHLLCFSARVIRACTERYGDVSGLGDALDDPDKGKALDEAVWILAQMMDAGARYAKLNGLECPEPLSVDAIYDTSDLGDFFAIRQRVVDTVTRGRTTHVEVQSPKNGEATQGDR